MILHQSQQSTAEKHPGTWVTPWLRSALIGRYRCVYISCSIVLFWETKLYICIFPFFRWSLYKYLNRNPQVAAVTAVFIPLCLSWSIKLISYWWLLCVYFVWMEMKLVMSSAEDGSEQNDADVAIFIKFTKKRQKYTITTDAGHSIEYICTYTHLWWLDISNCPRPPGTHWHHLAKHSASCASAKLKSTPTHGRQQCLQVSGERLRILLRKL